MKLQNEREERESREIVASVRAEKHTERYGSLFRENGLLKIGTCPPKGLQDVS